MKDPQYTEEEEKYIADEEWAESRLAEPIEPIDPEKLDPLARLVYDTMMKYRPKVFTPSSTVLQDMMRR